MATRVASAQARRAGTRHFPTDPEMRYDPVGSRAIESDADRCDRRRTAGDKECPRVLDFRVLVEGIDLIDHFVTAHGADSRPSPPAGGSPVANVIVTIGASRNFQKKGRARAHVGNRPFARPGYLTAAIKGIGPVGIASGMISSGVVVVLVDLQATELALLVVQRGGCRAPPRQAPLAGSSVKVLLKLAPPPG